MKKTSLFMCLILLGIMNQGSAQNATCGSCFQPGFNLAVNGSFNNSNIGFTNNLTFSASGTSSPGRYAVRGVSNSFWVGGCSIFDHTTGGGTEMLCIDGKTTGLTIAWDQTISNLNQNQDYIFSFYTRFSTCVASGLSPTIRVLINAAQVGDTINIKAGPWRKVSYLWNSGNASSAVIQILDTVQGAGGNDFIIDDISFAPCVPSTTVSAGNDVNTCAGSSVMLNSTGSGSGTCAWSGPAGLNNTGICNPLFSSQVPGDYSYIVSYSAAGCTVTDTVNIHVDGLPPVPTVYQYGDTLFSSFATGYQWYSSAGLLTGETGAYLLPSQTGYYKVSITDPKGCSAVSDSVLFTLCSELIQIDAGLDQSICSGEQVNLNATGNGSGSCEWNGPAGLTAYSGCSVIFNGTATGQFLYIVTDTSLGCSASDTISIEVHALPSVPLITRNGDSLVSSNASGYQWSSAGNQLAGEVNQFIVPSGPGFYLVEVTNGQGCATISDSVEFVPCDQLFSIQTLTDTSVCEGNVLTLTTNSGGQGNCSWTGPAGLNVYNTCNPQFSATASGDYTYVVSDQLDGCIDSDTLTIHVDALPPKPVIVQHGDSLITDGASGYQWYFNAMVIPGENLQFILPTQAGSYNVTVIDPKGCNNMSDSFVFNPCSMVIQVAASNDTAICEGTMVNLSLVSNGSGSCMWSGPAGLDNFFTCNPVFTPSGPGQFTYVVSDTISGCAASDTVVITVNSLPASPVVTIAGDSLISTPASMYHWFTSGLSIPGETNAWMLPAQAGYYYVEISNAAGCTAVSDSVYFTPCSTVLTLQSIPDTIVCAGIPVTLVTAGNGAGNCVWNGPAGLDNYNTCEPVFIAQTGGDYTYIVYDQLNGCSGTDTVNIHVHDLPQVPVVTQQNDTLLSTTAYAYQWYATGEPLWFENNYFLIPGNHAYYYVEITDSNGCKAVSDSLAPVFAGLEETTGNGAIVIKQYSSDGYLIIGNLSGQSSRLQITVYDMAGRLVSGSVVQAIAGSDTRFYAGGKLPAFFIVSVSNGSEEVSRKIFTGKD